MARAPVRSELLEEAAEASRVGLRSRRERAAAAARPIFQTAVAASAAWFIALELLGHQQPFFAPIAAVVTLGLTVGERRRRAVELAIGVAVGIAIADLLVTQIGTGTWQIGVTVALAMFAAILVGGGPLLASQAAASAVLVVALQPPESSFDFTRAVDGLVGAVTGVVIGSLLLPGGPGAAWPGAGAARCWTASPRLSTTSGPRSRNETNAGPRAPSRRWPTCGPGMTTSRTRSPRPGTPRACPSGGATPSRRWASSRSSPATHVWPSPMPARWPAGPDRAIAVGDATPAEVHEAVYELAGATRDLHAVLDGEDLLPSRERAVGRPSSPTPCWSRPPTCLRCTSSGQIRLLAVDLLRASGVERTRAQELVRGAPRVADRQSQSRRKPESPVSSATSIWAFCSLPA